MTLSAGVSFRFTSIQDSIARLPANYGHPFMFVLNSQLTEQPQYWTLKEFRRPHTLEHNDSARQARRESHTLTLHRQCLDRVESDRSYRDASLVRRV